jgi:23S rRNA (cytosine1962-C5)-methyltransferase
MIIKVSQNWADYELIDSGQECRLERYGKYILIRPDPQAIWKKKLPDSEWQKANAEFKRTEGEKGKWVQKNMPAKWEMSFRNLKFYCKLSPFKHTGIFPEQSVQWEFISNVIASPGSKSGVNSAKQSSKEINILNLFGYTGAASLAAAAAGAKVTHIDASYPTIGWARENQKLSGLEGKPIRWIQDDAIKFCKREIKRGVKYDGIILDPPAYGHGPEGETWKFNEHFPQLLEICRQILSDKPLFIIVNAYAISSSALMLENVLKDYFGNLGGQIEIGELALQEKNEGRLLSTGIFAQISF